MQNLDLRAGCSPHQIYAHFRDFAPNQGENILYQMGRRVDIVKHAHMPHKNQAILINELPSQPQPAKPASEAPPQKNNLPILPTPFIGRKQEVEALKALILNPANRLITLLGPGGTGKTRLAIETAGQLLPAFSYGVFFTALAPVQSDDAVLTAVTRAVSLPYTQESLEQLVLTAPVSSFEGYLTWLSDVTGDLSAEQVYIVDESTAAALGYAVTEPGAVVLVFDFGGGTLDLSLVQLPEAREKAGGVLGRLLRGNANQHKARVT